VVLALSVCSALDSVLGGAGMRVCHVCSAHRTDDARVSLRTCGTLAAAGYDVHLFAVGNRTETYRDRDVTIHPIPQCSSRRERLARRGRLARMAAAVQPDLFHVHEPELLAPVLARAGARPVIYDVHESFLDVLMDREWIPRRVRPAARFAWDHWERRMVRRCAGIVVATERLAPRYRSLHRRVQVVANYPDLAHYEDLPPTTRDGRTCVFAGVLLRNRGIVQVLPGLAILKQRGLSVRLELAGRPESESYLQSLWAEAERLGVSDLVTYHGVLSRAAAAALENRSSIALVPHLRVGNNLAAIPVKMLDCMALGLPIVYSDFPNHHEIAGVTGAGIAVDSARPEQVADAIERLVCNPDLARQMGEAGRRAVQERFNWSLERVKLLELYEQTLGRPERAEQVQRVA
jgi:glycosyltransferase involved in cell wall biosynthesis